jgi:6-methylsalicylate decarboxylase
MTPTNGWIDVHAHFSPPTSPEQRRAQLDGLQDAHFLMSEPFEWTPERAIASMDNLGIAMQLLSPIPLSVSLPELRQWNTYGALLVSRFPDRFGLLAGLPTNDASAALAEIARCDDELHPDGYLLTTGYAGAALSDPGLVPLWEELDRRQAAVFVHPSPEITPPLGQPAALLEVAFETARSVTDLLYTGFFRTYPHLKMVLAHCGGALPGLSGRLGLLGAESWVPNPLELTPEDIRQDLAKLYLDTAASGAESHIAAGATMVPCDHFVYGGDAGVPCSNDTSMTRNIDALRRSSVLTPEQVESLGRRAFDIFPAAAHRRAHMEAGTATPV